MSDGDDKKQAAAAEEDTAAHTPASAPVDYPELPPDAEGDPPKLDFATFVLSVATNALMSLSGESDDDRIPGARVDLKQASQHIDVLAMLETKTKGNLTHQEQDLLQRVLYDLRLRYVEAAKRH